MSAHVIQQFQANHFTPNRVVISASGVENHQEFVDLVAEKMHLTQLTSSSYQRAPSNYVGGEIRNYNDSSNVHVAFGFETDSIEKGWASYVAYQALGLAGNNESAFINSVQPFISRFTDSALIGIKLGGSASHVNEIVEVGAKRLSNLRDISEADVQRAKNHLKKNAKKYFHQTSNRLSFQTKLFSRLNHV